MIIIHLLLKARSTAVRNAVHRVKNDSVRDNNVITPCFTAYETYTTLIL